ncbi:MAG: hypothetical protein ACRELF_20105 [Gemmataceae bacterium]
MDWFEVIEGPGILQADVLPRCPVFQPDKEFQWPLAVDNQQGFRVKALDLIMMTQSCDLENDKVQEVLLARLIPWAVVVRDEVAKGNHVVKGSKFRKLLVEGGFPSLSLLHKREGAPGLDWSVVDFHWLYTLPKTFLSGFAASLGPRLRLRSPYREHLAQAFARYFMRVGLPHDARAFEKEGDVKP